jgi:hypothetical protein
MLSVLVPLEKYLDRKTRCHLRSTCKEARDVIMKPKSLRPLALKLNTSVMKKIDLLLSVSKVRCINDIGLWDDIEIYYGYKHINIHFLELSFKNTSQYDLAYFLFHKNKKFDKHKSNNTEFDFIFPGIDTWEKMKRFVSDWVIDIDDLV